MIPRTALAKWGSALVAEQQGRLDDAIAILEPISKTGNNRKSSMGHLLAVAGKTARARKILGELHTAEAKSYVPAYWFALVHAGLGERDQALQVPRAGVRGALNRPGLRPDRSPHRLAPDEPRFIALAKLLGVE